MWLWTTNLASRSSSTGSTVSRTTHRMSKRDKIGSVRSTWTYSFTASNLHSYNILFSYLTTLHFGFREPLVLLDIMPFCYTSTNKRNKKSHAGFTRLKKNEGTSLKKRKSASKASVKWLPFCRSPLINAPFTALMVTTRQQEAYRDDEKSLIHHSQRSPSRWEDKKLVRHEQTQVNQKQNQWQMELHCRTFDDSQVQHKQTQINNTKHM